MRSRPITFALAAPVLTAGMLLGIAAQRQDPINPEAVEPYHVRARAALRAVPPVIAGVWTGKDDEVPIAAQKLLRPNEILSRTYVENIPTDTHRRGRVASLLIVQCREPRDMLGHFPPVCYPSQGMELVASQARDWTVGGMRLRGMEYQFTERRFGQPVDRTVYNFFVMPNPEADRAAPLSVAEACVKRDMEAVRRASENYRYRAYGAAQVQVVFRADVPRAERDQVFATLMEPVVPVIRALALPAQSVTMPGEPAPGVVAGFGSSPSLSLSSSPLSSSSSSQQNSPPAPVASRGARSSSLAGVAPPSPARGRE